MTKAASRTLRLQESESITRDRLYAEAALDGVCANAMTAQHFALHQLPALDLTESVLVLRERAKAVNEGDLRQAETMLLSQAYALESIFAEMARRANNNLGHNLEVTERYLRLALKAQNQCRATLETLADCKSPPTVIARQANIAHGPQQVNNSVAQGMTDVAPARARKSKSGSNELLAGAGHGGKKLDARTAGAAAAGYQPLETVGAINRAGQRKGKERLGR